MRELIRFNPVYQHAEKLIKEAEERRQNLANLAAIGITIDEEHGYQVIKSLPKVVQKWAKSGNLHNGI